MESGRRGEKEGNKKVERVEGREEKGIKKRERERREEKG